VNAKVEWVDILLEPSSDAPAPSAAPQPMTAAHPSAPPPPSSDLADLLVAEGVISVQQREYALRVQRKLAGAQPTLRVLKDLGMVTPDQVRQTVMRNRHKVRLGTLLVELGYLKPNALEAALAVQSRNTERKRLGEILVAHRFIDEQTLTNVLSDQLGLPLADFAAAPVDRRLLQLASPKWCGQHRVAPIAGADGDVVLVMADPTDAPLLDAARQVFRCKVTPAIASPRAIVEALAAAEQTMQRRAVEVVHNDSTVVALVATMIAEALAQQASDIHVEPLAGVLRVRMRVDGVLVHWRDIEKSLMPAVLGRLKVLARADLAEKRRHQDGRILFEDPDTGVATDIRCSFYVTLHGEKVVMRLLNRRAELRDIHEIGMPPRVLERFLQDALELPSGIILVTGPTGSGKTTTLYGCVAHLNDEQSSIVTAEDPVEYVVDGIAQCSINPQINLTYEETLRHMVRQDPDVIVLGEIRDRFSAETAIQAALTGHKVLTTFHTEDTIGGLLRLMNMDIESFLISSTVVSVLAQRLVRRVCRHCGEPHTPDPQELQRLGLRAADLAGAAFRMGRGCEHCRFTGYAGRVGVFELLVLNEPVKDAILNRRTSYEIRRLSIETSGLVTLLEDGLVKAAAGATSLAEVIRHLPRLGRPRPLAELRRLMGL
jgi:type IV pilus assembly protein PilB